MQTRAKLRDGFEKGQVARFKGPLRRALPALAVKTSLLRSLYREIVIDWNDHHGKRSPAIVGDLRKRRTEGVPSHHRVFIIRREDHDMRVPVADPGSEVLIGRPHVRETHTVSLWKFTLRVRRLHAFSDLLWILSLHRELRSQLIVRHHFSDGLRIETNRRTNRHVVRQVAELRRRVCGGGESTHDHADETVVPLVNDVEAGGRQHFNRRAVRNVGRGGTLGQCHLRRLWHQIVTNRRVRASVRFRRLRTSGRDGENYRQQQGNQCVSHGSLSPYPTIFLACWYYGCRGPRDTGV